MCTSQGSVLKTVRSADSSKRPDLVIEHFMALPLSAICNAGFSVFPVPWDNLHLLEGRHRRCWAHPSSPQLLGDCSTLSIDQGESAVFASPAILIACSLEQSSRDALPQFCHDSDGVTRSGGRWSVVGGRWSVQMVSLEHCLPLPFVNSGD
jgi:hypothetical protein